MTLQFKSEGQTVGSMTGEGTCRPGDKDLTLDEIPAEVKERLKQYNTRQEKERRKLMRLSRKELEKILFYYMCIHDKQGLVEAILEQQEVWGK